MCVCRRWHQPIHQSILPIQRCRRVCFTYLAPLHEGRVLKGDHQGGARVGEQRAGPRPQEGLALRGGEEAAEDGHTLLCWWVGVGVGGCWSWFCWLVGQRGKGPASAVYTHIHRHAHHQKRPLHSTGPFVPAAGDCTPRGFGPRTGAATARPARSPRAGSAAAAGRGRVARAGAGAGARPGWVGRLLLLGLGAVVGAWLMAAGSLRPAHLLLLRLAS